MKAFIRVENPEELNVGDTVRVRRNQWVSKIRGVNHNWFPLEKKSPLDTGNIYGYWELDKEVDVPYKLPPVPKNIYTEEEWRYAASDIFTGKTVWVSDDENAVPMLREKTSQQY